MSGSALVDGTATGPEVAVQAGPLLPFVSCAWGGTATPAWPSLGLVQRQPRLQGGAVSTPQQHPLHHCPCVKVLGRPGRVRILWKRSLLGPTWILPSQRPCPSLRHTHSHAPGGPWPGLSPRPWPWNRAEVSSADQAWVVFWWVLSCMLP